MSTRKFTRYLDGYYGTPVRFTRTPREYPFAQNGDTTTAVYVASYMVDQAAFSPTARGTVDPENAGFYLIAESKPEIINGDIATFTRTYSNVPLQQTVVSSIILSKPSLSGTFPQAFGSFRLFQPDTTLLRFDAYAAQSVTSDSGAPSITPTGGTYTLSFGGDTTAALAYNAAAATVQTALNGLASIMLYGSVAVTGSYTAGFVVTFTAYAAASATISGLTNNSDALDGANVSTYSGGFNQIVTMTRALQTKPRIDFSPTFNTGSLVNYYPTSEQIHEYRSSYSASYALEQVTFTSLTTITGGTFTLTFFGQTTAPIAYNASLATVETALNALSKITAHGGVTVTYGAGGSTIFSGGTGIVFEFSFGSVTPYTAGTFTLTLFGQTTAAIAYNASIPAIESALNALSEVSNRGGCVVSGSGWDGAAVISFAFSFTAPAFTGSASSLTPAPCTVSISPDAIGRVTTILPTTQNTDRFITLPMHGFSSGDTLYFKQGSTYFPLKTDFSVISADQIRVDGAVTPYNGAAFTEVGKRTKTQYSPGVASVACRRITDFYLPGVTSGITTADDIPLPVNQSDGALLLLAIFAGTGTINIAVGELTQWRDSPILSLAKTTINAANV